MFYGEFGKKISQNYQQTLLLNKSSELQYVLSVYYKCIYPTQVIVREFSFSNYSNHSEVFAYYRIYFEHGYFPRKVLSKTVADDILFLYNFSEKIFYIFCFLLIIKPIAGF